MNVLIIGVSISQTCGFCVPEMCHISFFTFCGTSIKFIMFDKSHKAYPPFRDMKDQVDPLRSENSENLYNGCSHSS